MKRQTISVGEIVHFRDENGIRRKGRVIRYGHMSDGTGRHGYWIEFESAIYARVRSDIRRIRV